LNECPTAINGYTHEFKFIMNQSQPVWKSTHSTNNNSQDRSFKFVITNISMIFSFVIQSLIPSDYLMKLQLETKIIKHN
jgi:hypothetical protein